MISIVLYGRNDSYGYNLHKRAALSLNCMAEVLTGESDEILFVDYNTPDDYPTFVEAIADTLTDKARQRIRTFRVRPPLHNRFRDRTHLVALEPIARNVGIRRSNPGNRWILSTNTDMIFAPLGDRSLTDIVAGLADGLYHIPRFEIPESLWESLDRTRPAETIQHVEDWGRSFYLNERVYAMPEVLYDAPGDFQLLPRRDFFAIHGFHEGMLRGWHVDSNLSVRMERIYGKVFDLSREIYGYHCDHTRQVTPAHRPGRVENSTDTFITGVVEPTLPEQAEDWGLAHDEIEEIDVRKSGTAYIAALRHGMAPALRKPIEASYTGPNFDRATFDPRHVAPFILDILVNYPASISLGWFGCRRDLLKLTCQLWAELGRDQPVLVAQGNPFLAGPLGPNAVWVDPAEAVSRADVAVFDFGLPVIAEGMDAPDPEDLSALVWVASELKRFVLAERSRLGDNNALPRRLIAVNTINNRFEPFVRDYVAAAQAPYATRMRQGFATAAPSPSRSLLGAMTVNAAGERAANSMAVQTRAGVPGFVVSGPYIELDAGQAYRLTATFMVRAAGRPPPLLRMEVVSGDYLLDHRVVLPTDVIAGKAGLDFTTPGDVTKASFLSRWEFRIWSDGEGALDLEDLVLEERPGMRAQRSALDFLPLLKAGTAGVHYAGGDRPFAIVSRSGSRGHAATGPWLRHPAGSFVLEVEFGATEAVARKGAIGRIEIVAEDTFLSVMSIGEPDLLRGRISVPFRLDTPRVVEFRVWTEGDCSFEVRSTVVRAPAPSDADLLLDQTRAQVAARALRMALLDRLSVGIAGEAQNGKVINRLGVADFVVTGPYLSLLAGSYRLAFAVDAPREAFVRVEVLAGGFLKALHLATPSELEAGVVEVSFDVPPVSNAPKAEFEWEFRMWTNGAEKVLLSAVELLAGRERAEHIPKDVGVDWLPLLSPDEAGSCKRDVKTGALEIVSRSGFRGYVTAGPGFEVGPGNWLLEARIDGEFPVEDGGDVGRLEIWTPGTLKTLRSIRSADLGPGLVSVPFRLKDAAAVEVRLWTDGATTLHLRRASVRPGQGTAALFSDSATTSPDAGYSSVSSLDEDEQEADATTTDWLPWLEPGQAGTLTAEPGRLEIAVVEGVGGLIASARGPQMDAGYYLLSVVAAARGGWGRDCELGRLEVLSEGELVRVGSVKLADFEGGTIRIPLELKRAAELDLRIVSHGEASFAITAVRTTAYRPFARTPGSQKLDYGRLLGAMELGAASRRIGKALKVEAGQPGFALFGPYCALPTGEYVAEFEVGSTGAGLILLDVMSGPTLLSAEVPRETEITGGRMAVRFVVSRPILDCEIRLWSDGGRSILVEGMTLRRCGSADAPQRFDVLPWLAVRGRTPFDVADGHVRASGRRRLKGKVLLDSEFDLAPGRWLAEPSVEFANGSPSTVELRVNGEVTARSASLQSSFAFSRPDDPSGRALLRITAKSGHAFGGALTALHLSRG